MRWFLIWCVKIAWFGVALVWALHCFWLDSWIEPFLWGVISLVVGLTFDCPEK